MRLILNVGLDVNGTRAIAAHVALEVIKANGFIVLQHAVHQSDTEATLVALVDWSTALPASTVEPALYQTAIDLQQDCIAVHRPLAGNGRQGALIGPKPWGAFNPAFFLQLNGQRLAQPVQEAA